MDAADHLERGRVPQREFVSVLDEIIEYPREHYPVGALRLEDIDSPAEIPRDPDIERDWLETAHAGAGVNCSACHQPPDAAGRTGQWHDKPDTTACQVCHRVEVERFGLGKHGMRLAAGLAPMRPASARLPMRDDVAHRELTCNSCHPGHRFDTGHAAVDACLGCHADRHSLAYRGSPHHALWEAEQAGQGEPGSGVSCATCHMPRVDHDVSDWLSRKLVDHNQSATLSPNSKMIRPACLHCHGLGYAIDALADAALIERNFTGQPTIHVESIDLARADHERYLRERAAARE
jgi:formate-dependent nitrite reductase cytochrome c552 subunit